ncbi:uncharacterized protein [Onthophagus taurus]|uniref:uncharacterized protein n=1 Tax=Onthophagus taurus TaxID=166361 RepID=UPI000C20F513|nr:uncharacterized protein LOC111426455 [Onthophagus taurus]
MTPQNVYKVAKNFYKKLTDVFTFTTPAKSNRIQNKGFSTRKHKKFRNRIKKIYKNKLKTIEEHSIREALDSLEVFIKKSQHQLEFSISDQILGGKLLNRKLEITSFRSNFDLTSKKPQEYSKVWDFRAFRDNGKVEGQELAKTIEHHHHTKLLTDVKLMTSV